MTRTLTLTATLLALAMAGCATQSSPPVTDGVPDLAHVYTMDRAASGMVTVIQGQIAAREQTTTDDGKLKLVPFTAGRPVSLSGAPEIRSEGRAIVEQNGVIVAYDHRSSLSVIQGESIKTFSLPAGLWNIQESIYAGLMETFQSKMEVTASGTIIVPNPAGLVAYRMNDLKSGRLTPAWSMIFEQPVGYDASRGDRPYRSIRASATDPISGVTLYNWGEYGDENDPAALSRSHVTAVDEDGRELWTTHVADRSAKDVARTITVGAGENMGFYSVQGETRLHAVDLMTGEKRWTVEDAGCGESTVLSFILAEKGTVLPISAGDNCVRALNLDGTSRWRFDDQAGTFAGIPAIHQGVLYAANGRISALDLQSGKLLARSGSISRAQREKGRVVVSPDGQYVAAWGDQLGVYRTLP